MTTQTVIYATDGAYWMHVYISLYSLLSNNPSRAFDVYVLSEAPDEQFFANAGALAKVHRDVAVSFAPIRSGWLDHVPVTPSASRAHWYRLFMARLLPAEKKTALYLDADTIVRRSLDGLFELDVDSTVVAATPETRAVAQTFPARMGIPSPAPYFNAGVLKINLDAWRRFDVEEKCFSYVCANRSKPARLGDQDVLNAVLLEQWTELDFSFNLFDCTYPLEEASLKDLDPAVVHYALAKPWERDCRHPYRCDYWHYLRKTPYADFHEPISGLSLRMMKQDLALTLGRVPMGNRILRARRRLMAVKATLNRKLGRRRKKKSR